jgi:hypothetical protein
MPVESLSDTRVLIPRVRRALEGPDAVSGSAAIAAGNMSDDAVNAVIADAIASVIFYTGGLFGHALNVEERDEDYLAPIAWSVDPQFTEAEATVIVAQAALDYFFTFLRGFKVSQRIADEGQEWEYDHSAQVIAEQIKALRAARDEALALVSAENPSLDAWLSTIALRDAETSAIIEPWVHGGGTAGQEMGFVDPRFGTVP